MACPEFPQQPQLISKEAPTSSTVGSAGGHRDSVDRDLECLVCREPYGSTRLPKLLGCRHSFCAVCLKLLLCVQDGTWSVTCPLCRKATAVPGGLICSLRDQEAVLGRLARPGQEVQLCPQGLAGPATSTVGPPSLAEEEEQDAVSANRVAARRLVAHLLLLVLLIVLILPVIYPGVIRWVLSLIVTLALLMSVLFCCHSRSQGSCWPSPRTLFCREQKHNEISSIA
ncbi:E3 ubiquitin-protein ligase RNF186 [Camelus dromedarius]|uniref:RING-type E3 ubiquitin transferase n=1 Tax=Camelus dromedarius TaxID=9838 RepID=A0A5N4DAR1_CAMDR|nr:E3 ubiquitin-protein ligase RNF186 [Camelus dromedarius]KAB1268155.1 E3 ubiquitin-protein ligase RNF186 [Camelus dromedarius]